MIGLNEGTKQISKIRGNRLIRVYHVTGELGTSTEDNFQNSLVTSRANYTHVWPDKMNAVLSSMQASHQRKMFELCGVDIQSQSAYEIAKRGLIRPTDKTLPVLYGMKCIEFDRPKFTIEIHAINEYEKYFGELILVSVWRNWENVRVIIEDPFPPFSGNWTAITLCGTLYRYTMHPSWAFHIRRFTVAEQVAFTWDRREYGSVSENLRGTSEYVTSKECRTGREDAIIKENKICRLVRKFSIFGVLLLLRGLCTQMARYGISIKFRVEITFHTDGIQSLDGSVRRNWFNEKSHIFIAYQFVLHHSSLY